MSKSKRASAPVSQSLKLVPVIPLFGPTFHLSENSRATIAALKTLLRKAEAGVLPGFAFAAINGDEADCVIEMEAIGMASENKVFTIGMLEALSHQLKEEMSHE